MRTGIDAQTGKVLTGWDHVVQSIGKCLTTRPASRVMRRHLGCAVPGMQDANADPNTLLELYVSIAEALNDPDGGEPGSGASARIFGRVVILRVRDRQDSINREGYGRRLAFDIEVAPFSDGGKPVGLFG